MIFIDMNERQQKLEIHNLNKKIEGLQVLVDTLQTNLRSTVSHLSDEDKEKIVNVQSFKWSLNWRPGDEL